MKIQKKKSKKELEAEATKWIKAGKLYESPAPLTLNTTIGPEERRRLLGQGTRKPISIRIPENDLEAIKKIAKINECKYQQLIVKAVELYIDNYFRQMKTTKKKIRNY
jgi:hypothetical protein